MRRSSLLMAFALWSCADAKRGTEPTATEPTVPQTILGGVRGVVDVTARTLTFEQLPSATPDLVRLAGIYGDQGVTVRLYNTPVTVAASSTPGKETYTANVGLQNLLTFPIGDEQGGATPVDTMGIFVFMNSGPTVTATSSPCSPSCSVTVSNAHGLLQFTSLNQPYWHWDDRVGAVGSARDTTLVRRTWVFEADTQLTAFRFDVLVSAAWPPPNDTRWPIRYDGDSVPDVAVEPRWVRNSAGTSTITLNSPSAGIMTIVVPLGGRLAFYQSDSLNTTTNAYIEAQFRTNSLTMVGPEISFGIDDQVKFIAAGISSTQAGFLNSSFAFLPGALSRTTTTFHRYRIQKFAADSVQLLINDSVKVTRAYSTFSAHLTVTNHGFYFGPAGTGANPTSVLGNSSSWDYVIYEIGVTQP